MGDFTIIVEESEFVCRSKNSNDHVIGSPSCFHVFRRVGITVIHMRSLIIVLFICRLRHALPIYKVEK